MITIHDTIAHRLYISRLSAGLPIREPHPAVVAMELWCDAQDRADYARARIAARLPQAAIDAIARREWARMERARAVDRVAAGV